MRRGGRLGGGMIFLMTVFHMSEALVLEPRESRRRSSPMKPEGAAASNVAAGVRAEHRLRGLEEGFRLLGARHDDASAFREGRHPYGPISPSLRFVYGTDEQQVQSGLFASDAEKRRLLADAVLLKRASALRANDSGDGDGGARGGVAALSWYGQWCGGGHGGYQDCCDGGRCPSCNTTSPGVSEECLKECPPVDELDLQCAFHDHCTFTQDFSSSVSCVPQGNFCACDCILANRAELVPCGTNTCSTYRYLLYKAFEHAVSCVYIDPTTQRPACDGEISGRFGLDFFCPVNQLTPYGPACIPDNSPKNAYCNVARSGSGSKEYLCYDGYEVFPSTDRCVIPT